MTREQLEEHQIWIYGVALMLGAVFGLWSAGLGARLEWLISPVLAILLYSMFTQIPFLQLRAAFANRRFTAALLTVNFLIVPLVVWLLSRLLPQQPPLLLGVYLVLLTPCIDYVIVFTHLGRGDARLVLASTPLLLFVQMLLLPLYLWLFMGGEATQVMSAGPFLNAFLTLIVVPLGLALATEFWARRQRTGAVWLENTAWLPVPFMALTLFLVVISQIGRIEAFFPVVIRAVPIYVAFLVVMPVLSRLTARAYRLDTRAGRGLVFSAGTRNSLVVLPLALALPDAWAVVPAVVVTQTLVELVGELFYIRLVPSVLYREPEDAG
ncbi:arsenic resistance protein [Saccharospirillum salsuginis]|uniref:Arsenic resistance protein n=1 Tax=Saccharospirillum salsuginis TaxID=418750 RepID=A0A918KLL7_9GAMM|nr:bile acid:sodium symporter [Saccharospirillum salsuginis]GGX67718.1 arsenic resistance protein [Saccharospirillum salsuginis]